MNTETLRRVLANRPAAEAGMREARRIMAEVAAETRQPEPKRTPTPVLVAAILGALAVPVAIGYLISLFFTHGPR